MSYTKKTWKAGDTITAEALNNLESGASANASAIAEIEQELPSYVGADVPRKAAETITPGTANQTIAANQYLTGAQTIKGDSNLTAGNIKKSVSIFGVTGTLETGSAGTDTSDATAEAADIIKGKTAYIASGKTTGTLGTSTRLLYAPTLNGDGDATVAETSITTTVGSTYKKICVKAPSVTSTSGKTVVDASNVEIAVELTGSAFGDAVAGNVLSGKTFTASPGLKVKGTMSSKAAETITPSTADKTIAAGQYLAGAQTIKGDGNLSAGNIKKGVSIFGVTGTYVGNGSSGGGGSGSTVKTGSFTGAGTEEVIETGLSSISVFMVYDKATTIHAEGLVCAFVDVEGGITGRGIGCTSYSSYFKNVSISDTDVLTVSGGTITVLASSTGYKPISNATYKWCAVGGA